MMLSVILLCAILIELTTKPRIDITKTEIFLWYGIKQRKYIKIK